MKLALVTGGTRGIGEAISDVLKKNGYKVVANYGHNDERAKAFSDRTGIPTFKFDVCDFDSVSAGINAIGHPPMPLVARQRGILHQLKDGATFSRKRSSCRSGSKDANLTTRVWAPAST